MVQIGDMTIQDEAVVLPSTFVGVLSKDLTDAAGTQSITGVGFRPSSVIFACIINGTVINSHGRTDGSGNFSVSNFPSDVHSWDNTKCIVIESVAANNQNAAFLSFDTDGFSLTWTKNNAPTGTARITFTAFK